MKTKHQHVIQATIVTQSTFNPEDLAAAAATQKKMTDDASKLVGFISVTTRMTKAPVADPLDIPANMKR